MKRRLQKLLANWLVHALYNTITADDVIQFRGRSIWISRKALKPEVAAQLAEDADRFAESAVWKILFKEVQFAANERMFREAITTDDILFGKAILYANKVYSDCLTKLSLFAKNEERVTS